MFDKSIVLVFGVRRGWLSVGRWMGPFAWGMGDRVAG